jgi:Glycosyl transferase family 2
VTAALKRHWVFAVLLALGVALRVLVAVAYRPAIFYIDSMATYVPAVRTLDPNGQNPIGYVLLLLKPVLAVGDFTAVVAVQHLLGLGMAVTTYALLVGKGAGRWLAALATAPILLDAYQVQIEHNIMADSLFQAMLVAALALLAWPQRPGWRVVAAAGLLLGAAVTVRTVGQVMIVPAVLYLLLAGRGWRARAALCGLVAVCFALPVVAYAAYNYVWTDRYGPARFSVSASTGNALYGRTATFADCAGLDLPAHERPLCPTQPADQRQGPDWWAHDPASPAAALQANPPPGKTVDQVLGDFGRRVIRHQPLDFARAVLADAARVFAWQRTDGPDTGYPPVGRWQFQEQYPTFPGSVEVDTVSPLTAQYGGGEPTAVVPLAKGLRWYQLNLGYTPGPALALAVLAALAGCALGRGRRAPPLRAAAALYLAGGALLLLAAAVFEFSWRYQLPGYVLLPAAGVLGLTALTRREPRPPFPEPADERAIADLGQVRFPDVVVLVAAYNEGPTLGPVLDSVPPQCLGLKVATLVVVDGASDDTAEVARAHGAHTCVVAVNRGQGAALRLGYHLARAGGCRYIVTTDADGQYDMAELPRLLRPLVDGEADFVTGSRRLGADESTDPVRRAGTRVFAWLVSLLGGHRVTDTSFGFRAMRAEVTARVTLDQPQYQSAELLVGVLSHGYRVVERPMTMRRRGAGRSKKGNNLLYGWRYARVVLTTWWRERKITRSSRTNLTRNIAA